MKKTVFLSFGLVLVLISFVFAYGSIDESEPNDDFSQADYFGTLEEEKSGGGYIRPETDIDFYSVEPYKSNCVSDVSVLTAPYTAPLTSEGSSILIPGFFPIVTFYDKNHELIAQYVSQKINFFIINVNFNKIRYISVQGYAIESDGLYTLSVRGCENSIKVDKI